MCKRKFSFFSGAVVVRTVLRITVIAVLLPIMISCGSGNGSKPSALVSHWLYESGSGADMRKMELYKDGTGVCDGGTVSWKVEDKRFVILSSSTGYAYDYKVSGSKLILISDGKDSTTYVTKAERERVRKETIAAGKFTDSRDGKTYKVKAIGEQIWMAENLNYKTDGGSYCYGNDDSNCAKYGRLYTWNTALKACPAGWHLPANQEWQTLEDFAGGKTAGTKLKSTSGWNNNGNGTDDYGFSALPGGYRYSDGSFSIAGNGGYWWSAAENDADSARGRYMYYIDSYVYEGWDYKSGGLSVRCLRD